MTTKTEREISEQPEKFEKIVEQYEVISSDLLSFLKDIEKFSEIDFVGCGSSYYLSMGLSFHLNRVSKGKVISKYFSGSEVAFGLRNFQKNSVLIGISRSGESSETILALRRAKENGVKTCAITCNSKSELANIADISANLDLVNEESVVMTQSFTSMAFLGTLIIRNIFDLDLKDYMKSVPDISSKILENSKNLFDKVKPENYEHFVFLGYDEYFASSMEGVIKVSETSLTPAEAYQTLEYRHGPKSKVNDKTLAVILANDFIESEEEKMAKEIEQLGGSVIVMSKENTIIKNRLVLPFGDFSDWFVRVIPLQIIGVRKSLKKGLMPDAPKNLTKVVRF
ncbi:SIS domain-containing protein [Athalassotoga saccharophila]|uniref:SIS domain-containing protein n=1 Tax=Athalassotoga saccharophila TaxID=1441386 RepID=UPI00137B67B9|nr:SIS domain-containing protein [Athalassotoga saccharophila]BBJ28199.1 glutamine--fructose-6-phosphate aminotransferase [isomerizing] [Athalassotoga saccharophila]